MSRMIQIDDFIKELQETRRKFGNTCVYIRDVSWGAVALNRQIEDNEKKPTIKEDTHNQVVKDLERIKRYLVSSAKAVGDNIHGYIETMDYCIEHFQQQPVQSDAHGCSLCVPYQRVIPGIKFCGACGAPLN